MGLFAIVSLTFALVILYLACSAEASTGFVVPLISRTSPKHPLYNTKATPTDIVRNKIRISAERERFFAQKRRGLVVNQVAPYMAPIDDEMVMTYFIGTPPVETIAYADTGSSLIWIQCRPCLKCHNQTKPIFDPTRSSSFKRVPCESADCNKKLGLLCGSKRPAECIYRINYADGSTSRGVVTKDTISMPETKYSYKFSQTNTVFGCGTYNFHTYPEYNSGVVGLQNVSLSLLGQMAKIGVQSFSYCKNEQGGYIRFGYASILVGQKTRLFTDRFNAYQIIMLGIEAEIGLKTEKVEIDSGLFAHKENDPNSGVLVDSGTPYTRLNPVAFKALKVKIESLLDGKEAYETEMFKLCYNEDDYNGDLSVETLPSVHFILDNGVTIKFPNKNIWSAPDFDGNICLRIFPSQSNMTIIGSEQLANYNVGFDIFNNLLWLSLGCVSKAF